MTTLSHLLQQHYENRPERIAIYLQQAGVEDAPVSYRALLHGANAYANALLRAGVQPGEVTILILQHSQDLIFAFYGGILAGIIPSIMPFLTEKLSPERYRADLTALIAITRPSAIITYPEFAAEVKSALGEEDSVRVVLTTADIPAPCSPDFATLPGFTRAENDIALLQHSSGTTGLQKGVALAHRAVLNQLQAYRTAIHLDVENDVIVSWLPLYHDMGLIACFILPVILGVPLVLMSPFDWVRAPYRLMQSVSRYRGTLTWLPNFAYNFCAQKTRERNLEGVDLSSWRAIINCSEPVRWESHQAFLQKFQPYALNPLALQTCYAMAENVFGVTQSDVSTAPIVDVIDRELFSAQRVASPPADGRPAMRMLSSGRPLNNTKIRVVDEQGHDLPERAVGEIALQSDCMLSEYFHRPDATHQAIHHGWYFTGDYGYMADGELFVSGRKKDMIIVGGKNIYPQDLETLVSEVRGVHPGRVVAFGLFDDESGTEEVAIIAEVDEAALGGVEQLEEEIRQHVAKNSAISPRYVHLVGEKWILKTSSGKTARAANKEKFIQTVLSAQ